MLALEAMTTLVKVADDHMAITRNMAELQDMTPEQREWSENIEVAISIVTAMLNTALPVARYRCFVAVDPKSSKKSLIRDEFTICSATMAGIIAGLTSLDQYQTDVYTTLWEQRAEGAEMLSGYQGPSKVKRYRSWLASLPTLEITAPVQ